MTPSNLLDRIKERCEEEGVCWIWKGGSKKVPHWNQGDGKVSVRKMVLEALGKELLPGYVPGITCGSLKCVSPHCVVARSRVAHAKHHASLGAYSTPAKTAKMAATKRSKSKLDDEKVLAIRASTKTGKQLSAEYGVAASYINSIRAGLLWKNYASPFAGLGAR